MTIEQTLKQVTDQMRDFAAGWMVGSRADKLVWFDMCSLLPGQITTALQDAGFAIVPIGGDAPTSVTIRTAPQQFLTEVRVQVEMPKLIAYAAQRVPFELLGRKDFMRNHLPRQMASTVLSIFEPRIAERIAEKTASYSAKTSANGPPDNDKPT